MATHLRWGRISLLATVLVAVSMMGEPAWAQAPTLTITLTGQCTIRSDLRSTAPAAMPAISALVKGADVVFTNFEGVIALPGQPNEMVPQQGLGYLAPPGALDSLKALGFNLVSLSDNHSADLKVPGVLNTINESNRVGLAHAGTGNTLAEAAAPTLLKTPHGTVALVSLASGAIPPGGAATPTQPGVNELHVGPGNVPREEDANRILQSIRDAAKNADFVVVYHHNHVFDKPFGTIFTEALPDRLVPSEWLQKWVHQEVDAGADLIVMHGAPLLHGIEIYHGVPIFYDLGNFIYNVPLTGWTTQEPMVWESVVATLQIHGKNVQSIKLRPITLNFLGEGPAETHDPRVNNRFVDTRGLPAPARLSGPPPGSPGGEEDPQATYILQRVAKLSKRFGTTVDIKGDIAEVALTTGK